jgi:dTDP-4-amino-4,6-dideoxygalactose transaminase
MKLAVLGGSPVRSTPFPSYNVIGREEIQAVRAVLETGVLSKYLGAWHADFFGGPKVQEFEQTWSERLGANYTVSVNSATSGLYAACAAAGFGPGDEVIVSPYTMSASAIAPVVNGAIPVFADIDPETFCLSAKTIEQRITPRTKGIIVVHIFGGPAEMAPIIQLAKKHNLVVIEDCAQAPMGRYNGQNLGLIGDMGVFSLNYHKHIHTGEGGLIVTNQDKYAERLQLVRNHAEAVTDRKAQQTGSEVHSDLVGFNYRLGEVESAIGLSLLNKLPSLLQQRIENVEFIENALKDIPWLKFQKPESNDTHCYYVHAITFDQKAAGVPRNNFVDAVKAELAPCQMRMSDGVLIGAGYVAPLYRQSFYQKRIHPVFNSASQEAIASYELGNCPTVEYAHESTVITHELMRPGMSQHDLSDVVTAFRKVSEHINQLTEGESKYSIPKSTKKAL